MPLVEPLNDQPCLGQVHRAAEEFARTPEAQELARQFRNRYQIVRFIRQKPQRDDHGDPTDGPRIQCDVSQRLRLDPDDPNCFERLPLYLSLTLIVEPTIILTSATMGLDNGLHSFPVEIGDDQIPRVVILDPLDAPLANAMTATAYQTRNASPAAAHRITPWFVDMSRNACRSVGALDCHRLAMRDIRRALITGHPFQHPTTIDCVLDCAEHDARLFRPHGPLAFDRMYRSLRNLSMDLENGKVTRFMTDFLMKAGPITNDIVKAAFISQFGPAAQLAFHQADVIVQNNNRERQEERAERLRQDLEPEPGAAKNPAKPDKHKPDQGEIQARLRRMTFASLQPHNQH